ncbi:CDP photolyase [Lipomyces doorenjongii]
MQSRLTVGTKRKLSTSRSPSSSRVTCPASDEFSAILSHFYPRHEISNAECDKYIHGIIPRPLSILEAAVSDTAAARNEISAKHSVIHWFKRDLRTHDNKSLSLASQRAEREGVPLICVFLISEQDYEAHLTSPARVNLEIETVKILKADLEEKLDVPLYVELVGQRKDLPTRIIQLCEKFGARHLFCNIEYEVDELRREALLIRRCADDAGIDFTVVHDTCVVQPGELATKQGKQYAVFTPWYKSWLAHIRNNEGEYLHIYEYPSRNHHSARTKFKDIYVSSVPDAPARKALANEEKNRLQELWPAGEHEALSRLQRFLDEKSGRYKVERDFPAADCTSLLSPYIACGALSARTIVKSAMERNDGSMDGRCSGIATWTSEIAWREFYKHVLVHWPYICMDKPFKLDYSDLRWEYNSSNFSAWCTGKTGYPLVDAAMRQLRHTGYMHNRCRMIVASFLSKDLLLDWRMGERYFMSQLVDGDFASNNGGWGFASSTGVDPQPYFRVFNPVLQSEKFDPDGVYIKKWVPELQNLYAPAIHFPYERGGGEIARRAGYPRPIVDHQEARKRALARYREALGRY